MNVQTAVEIMERHGVNPTANRITIVRALAEADGPMSLAELEGRILTIDKSSISRALAVFRARRLVHTIENGSSTRYELCMSHSDDDDDDMHVHFYCERCHRTTCLENCPIPATSLPEDYLMKSSEYTVRGICPECRGRRGVTEGR